MQRIADWSAALWVVSAALLIAGCSSGSSPATPRSDSFDTGVADDAASDLADTLTPTDTGAVPDTAPDTSDRACGAPEVNDGPEVAADSYVGSFAAPLGGTIVPGRYHLIKAEVRGGTSGTRKFVRTVSLTATHWGEADRDPRYGTEDDLFGGTMVTSGTDMYVTYDCGSRTEPHKWLFTVDGDRLLLLLAPTGAAAPALRFTYERQP